jgi:hypothetical protein
VTAALFLIDFIVPDLVPVRDEILLGVATLLLGAWRKQKQDRRIAGETKRLPTASTGDASQSAT